MNRLNTLSDAVATHARLSPAKLAVRDSRRSLSYAQWHDRTERLAAGLRTLGLEKGDRVALLAYNCWNGWKSTPPSPAPGWWPSPSISA